MATFYKIKAKERREIQRAIMRAIQQYGLVDTYSMKDSIRVMTDSRVTLSGIYIKVSALYYFRFHDDFAADGKCTKNNVCPEPIIATAFSDPKVQTTLANIEQKYIDWLVNNNSIFAVADIDLNQAIYVGFEFFGSEDSRWNKGIAFSKLG